MPVDGVQTPGKKLTRANWSSWLIRWCSRLLNLAEKLWPTRIKGFRYWWSDPRRGLDPYPAIQKIVKDFFGKEPSKGVNPDEVVAIGAAIQEVSWQVKSRCPVTWHYPCLGYRNACGVMTRLIESNTPSLHVNQNIFTAADSQTSVEIHILQGERPMANQNKSIGRFHLDGIPPAPRGIPQIEVTFWYWCKRDPYVAAKDKAPASLRHPDRSFISLSMTRSNGWKMKPDKRWLW